jgi:hypothetical protein
MGGSGAGQLGPGTCGGVVMPAAVVPNTADWLAQLAGVPLPGRSQEEWRFTGLAALQTLAPELWNGVSQFTQFSLPAGISPHRG